MTPNQIYAIFLLYQMKTNPKIKAKLDYLRGEIQNERISYGEIVELQSLVKYIEPGDNLLLEWSGTPEF